jgi:hypothetical protein
MIIRNKLEQLKKSKRHALFVEVTQIYFQECHENVDIPLALSGVFAVDVTVRLLD